jgi:peroxiredoxin
LNTAELSDPVQKARSFHDQHNLTYPILVDTDGAVRRALTMRHARVPGSRMKPAISAGRRDH